MRGRLNFAKLRSVKDGICLLRPIALPNYKFNALTIQDRCSQRTQCHFCLTMPQQWKLCERGLLLTTLSHVRLFRNIFQKNGRFLAMSSAK